MLLPPAAYVDSCVPCVSSGRWRGLDVELIACTAGLSQLRSCLQTAAYLRA